MTLKCDVKCTTSNKTVMTDVSPPPPHRMGGKIGLMVDTCRMHMAPLFYSLLMENERKQGLLSKM